MPLVGDGLNGIALFPLDQFEVVSQKIPPTWVVTWSNKGYFELTTDAWSEAGFWERFYDGDPVARKKVEDEMRKIVEAEP